MQVIHEAFLRGARKETQINLAQRETCFLLHKCCLCKHKHATPLSVSHVMQTHGRADLCGHTPGLVPPPPAPPSVAASALPYAGAGESAQTSTRERGTRKSTVIYLLVITKVEKRPFLCSSKFGAVSHSTKIPSENTKTRSASTIEETRCWRREP